LAGKRKNPERLHFNLGRGGAQKWCTFKQVDGKESRQAELLGYKGRDLKKVVGGKTRPARRDVGSPLRGSAGR